MKNNKSYLRQIEEPHSIITPIQSGVTFPELLKNKKQKYTDHIQEFSEIVSNSKSSAELLRSIRNKAIDSKKRMTFLKLFRRCVSPICDTEATKKIVKNPTSLFVDNYGHTFKDINILKKQFTNMSDGEISALSVLLGEYDDRGTQGYDLTELFFTWFEKEFKGVYTIDGPRRAGQDIQLSNVLDDFEGDFPCDFIVKKNDTDELIAVGFARYDSTRGGAQSDDRTGGNSNKVTKSQEYFLNTGKDYKLIFLSDGPGLTHGDTWEEACNLDDSWEGRVRVSTLISCKDRITVDWLES